ncbi:killer toxin subunits alpha beta [Fusarium tjaetaba]|uniref:Killer toxin subunits alpha beta n=1 Tax=Fusarium tjaetaba TaxID=1567544 RepID=A0A8H5RJ38_9HYPO|nr:killer toxin subunits alpha beta [Fusarium tjaetaba]KAF5635636.1 killer toxin subunits alpha beta [Fusarium tjaetaba]
MIFIFTLVASVAFPPLTFHASVHAANIDDLKGATDTFSAALGESQYNLTEADGDVGDFATRLFGFEGCGGWGSPQRKAIYSGWQQAWHMMDAIQGKELNWNEAAAIEFFAPPFINEAEQPAIKEIIDTVVTIRAGSSLNPFQWKLHVRCDDPSDICKCKPNTQLAYTTNKDHDTGKARIAFCPNYFLEPDLLKVIDENSKKELPIEHRADLNNYVRNKGRVWFHELLHVDWASGVDPRYHIVDLYALYSRSDQTVVKQKIYNTAKTKGLAAFHLDPAWWIKRSADNFAMYAMAKTVQKITGNYPHLPFASTLECVYDIPHIGLNHVTAGDVMIVPEGQGKCQAPNNKHIPRDKSLVVPLNSTARLSSRSYYPEDYNRQLRGWLADSNPRHNRVRIVLMQASMEPQWIVLQDTHEEPIKYFCLAAVLTKVPAKGGEDNPEFPTELPAFEAHGAKGCVYSGTSSIVGSLACENGPPDIRCWEDPEWREMSYCDGGKYMLGIKCDWA